MTRSTAGASSDPARSLVPPLTDADVPTSRPPAHSAGNRASRVPDLLPTHLVAAQPVPPVATLASPAPSQSRPRPDVPAPVIMLLVAAAVLLGIVLYLVVTNF
jgi:hypothetical protein